MKNEYRNRFYSVKQMDAEAEEDFAKVESLWLSIGLPWSEDDDDEIPHWGGYIYHSIISIKIS
jgi:hypothetical protein